MKSIVKLIILINLISIAFSAFPYPEESPDIPVTCNRNCDVPFGNAIGKIGFVVAYSNCNPNCMNNIDGGSFFKKIETGFKRDVYTGLRWQCVEYGRRWLIINHQVTFEDIESAFQIYDLNTVEDLYRDVNYKFESIPNYSETAPRDGDLIIYPKASDAPAGHVAVASKVDLVNGFIEIAEQNYNNTWQNPQKYCRKNAIIKCKSQFYTLTELPWTSDFFEKNKDKLDEICETQKGKTIGFKRVLKNTKFNQ